MWYSAEWSVSMNGNRIPDYDIADIVPEYTGFTQDVKTQQQKQTAGEKANARKQFRKKVEVKKATLDVASAPTKQATPSF